MEEPNVQVFCQIMMMMKYEEEKEKKQPSNREKSENNVHLKIYFLWNWPIVRQALDRQFSQP